LGTLPSANWDGGEGWEVKKGVSLISRGLQRKKRGEKWVKSVTVAEVNLGGGLASESEKWELVVSGTWILG